jgi:hypothetical protein
MILGDKGHLSDDLMMICNSAKQLEGSFARIADKVAAFTILQYFNLPIIDL